MKCPTNTVINGLGILDRTAAGSRSGNLGIGITPYFRYSLFNSGVHSAFFEVGIGGIYYLRDYPDGGSHLNFSRQFGAGFRKRLRARTLFVATRWFHTSNQNLYGKDRNPGLNAAGVFIGMERRAMP